MRFEDAGQFDPRMLGAGQLAVRWLGQSGFELLYGSLRLMIDPYLSDHLAEKYAGKEFPHIRMMPPPYMPDDAGKVDVVLCTHRHSDHMDPKTVPVLLRSNPQCKLIAPRAETEHLQAMGVDPEQCSLVNAFEEVFPVGDVRVYAIPSAHEDLNVNARGEHHYLGYVLRLGQFNIYHSGDCVPYAGLSERLKMLGPDIMMLPVNGRDAYRKSRGVSGNFTFEEAVDLCRQIASPVMICHHFGMFAFNTVDTLQLLMSATKVNRDTFSCVVPDTGRYMIYTALNDR